jgi:anaerobic magnesium-protoporphyrin IX monomethyl ester cyclase
MRITFVAIGCEQLGISLLSALAKKHGHEVHLAFSMALFNDRSHLTIPKLGTIFDDTSQVLADIRRQQPDVLAFSPVSGTYRWMLNVAREAKRMMPQVKTIFGGVHPSAVPDRVLAQEEVDYVCVGEGEIAFMQILKHIAETGNGRAIPNTRHKLSDGQIIRGEQMGFIQDLDSLPPFDKTIWEDHIPLNDTYLTMASRGCPFRCTFCFNCFYADLPGAQAGRYVRYRSPGHVIKELLLSKRRYRFRMVEFFDDVFTYNKKWLKEFLEQYQKVIGVPFQCFTHIQHIDAEVGQWLAAAGCRSAQIGLQTMDQAYKQHVLNRREDAGDFERALLILRRNQILAKFDHMFGLPGEPLEAMEKAKDFYTQHAPYRIQTYWFNPYPGTKIVQQALQVGVLTTTDIERINDGECFDSFTRSNQFIDPQKVRTYQIYELLFKILPSLPRALRKALRARSLLWIPSRACAFLTLVSDIAIGFLRLDIDHFFYAKSYLQQIKRFIWQSLGRTTRPLTRVFEEDQVFGKDMLSKDGSLTNFNYPEKEPGMAPALLPRAR